MYNPYRKEWIQEESRSVIIRLIDTNEINGNTIKNYFPAKKLVNPVNFISRLYYLGLLTYDRVEYGEAIMRVPNQIARKQIYSYLIETI